DPRPDAGRGRAHRAAPPAMRAARRALVEQAVGRAARGNGRVRLRAAPPERPRVRPAGARQGAQGRAHERGAAADAAALAAARARLLRRRAGEGARGAGARGLQAFVDAARGGSSAGLSLPMACAGLPATTAWSGTSRITTAPAPTTAKRPMRQPSFTTAPGPMCAPTPTWQRPETRAARPAKTKSATTLSWPICAAGHRPT